MSIAQHGTVIMMRCHIYNYRQCLANQMAGEGGGQIHLMDDSL